MKGYAGYPMIAAAKGVTVRRHVIVCEAYHGERPAKSVVRHKNGIAGDDRAENLEWGSQADNCKDTIRHGKTTIGTKNYHAKLTENEVLEIRTRAAMGESQRDIGNDFGISQGNVSNIVTRRAWKHVP